MTETGGGDKEEGENWEGGGGGLGGGDEEGAGEGRGGRATQGRGCAEAPGSRTRGVAGSKARTRPPLSPKDRYSGPRPGRGARGPGAAKPAPRRLQTPRRRKNRRGKRTKRKTQTEEGESSLSGFKRMSLL